MPPTDELERVIVDICTGGIPVFVNGGKVYHSDECQARKHVLQNVNVKRSLRRLKEETFNVAIHPNIAVGPLREAPLLGGQPIAIAFSPEITFKDYPDHPHLNMGNHQRLLPSTHYLLPDTLCYTHTPNGLGEMQRDRLLTAFDEVTIWLLRYQIWLATRALTGHGIWIGPQEGQIYADWYPLRLNPEGQCHCGSIRKPYKDCHMTNDLATVKQKHGDAVTAQMQLIDSSWWVKTVYLPQKKLFDDLKQQL